MEITGLQIVFILSALVEWIFTESTKIMRGYWAEGWEMPAGLAGARFLAVFGILFAYYIGGRLIYRKKSEGSRPIALRRRGVMWVYFSMSHIWPIALWEICSICLRRRDA